MKKLREQIGLTQTEMAKLIGLIKPPALCMKWVCVGLVLRP